MGFFARDVGSDIFSRLFVHVNRMVAKKSTPIAQDRLCRLRGPNSNRQSDANGNLTVFAAPWHSGTEWWNPYRDALLALGVTRSPCCKDARMVVEPPKINTRNTWFEFFQDHMPPACLAVVVPRSQARRTSPYCMVIARVVCGFESTARSVLYPVCDQLR